MRLNTLLNYSRPMFDEDIQHTINELSELLCPKALLKLNSHLMSLMRQIDDLTKSRDNWRAKAEKIKGDKAP